jgi:hypothetical protein
LETRTPLLLFPVRVQVKFIRNSDEDMERYQREEFLKQYPNVKRQRLELLVRIYPDQLSIARHEEGLTESEVAAGQQYWLQALTSPDRVLEAHHSLLAWRVLLGRNAANRAYWIVQQTMPKEIRYLVERADGIRRDLDQLEGGFTLQDWPTDFLDELQAQLVTRPTSASAWEQAARATCLPDRFVVALYNKIEDLGRVSDEYINELLVNNQAIRYNPQTGATDRRDTVLDQDKYREQVLDLTSEFLELVRTEAGQEIVGNELTVGLNGGAGKDEQHEQELAAQLDETKGLGGELEWLADFNRAVEVGMGIIVGLDDEKVFTRGFDRLVVAGVRANRSPEEESEHLTRLLLGHTYADGLDIVPQGTPTNNTSGEGAGYSSAGQYDADATFRTFLQGPLFDEQSSEVPISEKQDGQRLAEALGVAPEVLAHTANADRADGQEAMRLNKVLWPATFGYYAREMLEPILGSSDMTRATQAFFEAYVTGRGPVPAFRVDNVPYGVLLTTWYSQWLPRKQLDTFGDISWDLIRRFDVTWTERLNAFAEYPPDFSRETPFFSAPPSRQDILTVLGQEAASVEFYQRYFVGTNLMDTLAHRAEELNAQQGSNIKVWPPVPTFDTGGVRGVTGYVNNVRQNLPARFDNVGIGENPLYSTFLTFFDPKGSYGKSAKVWSRAFDVNYQMGYRKVVHTYADEPQPQLQNMGPVVDNTPLSETNPVKPLVPLLPDALAEAGSAPDSQALHNYIHWLADSSFDEIRLQDFRPRFPSPNETPKNFEAPKSLLYYLLRQAVMWRYWEAAEAVLLAAQSPIPRQETELFNILTDDVARWQWLYTEFKGETMHVWLRKDNHPEAQRLREYLKELRSLATLPTARLERLLAEHLDLGNHRLDAWKTGHVLAGLLEQRRDAPRGNYLGAFGWLEEVYPRDQSKPEDDGRRFDPDNLGYIHAPTINHGVTAAVLRQGYKSRQFETDPARPEANRMAINLSSERVRRALAMMEGVRTGNSLTALLGRDFEEGLFRATPANQPSYALQIEGFRRRYPNASEKALPGQATHDSSPEQDARQVVNGLDLVKQLPLTLPPKGATDPLGITINDGPERVAFWRAVRTQVAELQNTLDALGDLTVGESIHQAVTGNVEQAAAILENVAKGKFPPSPDVVHPSRAGVTLTHRVLLQLPQTAPAQLAAWKTASVLAQAEPALNRWLAGLLGNPSTVTFHFDYEVPGTTPVLIDATTTLDKLGLHPIDVLFLLEQQALQSGSAFDAVLARAIRQDTSLSGRPSDPAQTGTVTVHYASAGLDPLRHLLPLLARIRQLLATSRPASATDLTGPSQEAPGQPIDSQGGLLPDTRLTDVYDALEAAATSITTAVAAIQTLQTTTPPPVGLQASLATAYQGLRNALHSVGAYNLPDAYLAARPGQDDALGSATAIVQVIQRRLAAADRLHQQAVDSPNEGNAATRYADIAKALLGNDFRVSVPFQLSQDLAPGAVVSAQAAYQAAFDSRTSLLRHHQDNPDVMSEWLQGLAPVRDAMHHLEKVLLLNELLWDGDSAHALPNLTPVQLSTREPAGEYWLGATYPGPPDEDYSPPGDAVSLVQMLPTGYSAAAGAAQQALWLDEWTEIIPRQEEDTSLVFHYDQPNTEAPQTLLLAVAPNPDEYPTWDWNTVLGVVNESLDFAKKRAVEPANLSFTHLGCLLPTLVAPVAQEGVTMNLDFRQLTGNPQFLGKPYLPGK